jgi:hypothetical protein
MAKYGPKPLAKPSSRLILGDGKVRLGVDKDMDALFHKIMHLPRGRKFRTVCAWLISGARMEQHVPDETVEEINQASLDLVENLVE